MRIPLLDLQSQYRKIKEEIDARVQEVFASQVFIIGPEVSACEEDIAAYCGVPYACGVSSGSDALLIAMMIEGIGPGDEIITTAYSFFSTAGSIVRTGARPVFVDIDPLTFNMRTDLIEEVVTEKTRAIIPVHLYGQASGMGAVHDLARRYGLTVIEDACQAIGAEHGGKRAGALGDYGCFSFFPSKNLGGAGDGGMVTCHDARKAELLHIFRNHGMHPKYHHRFVGGNFRLDALQAAVIRVKLRYLDEWTEKRRDNAAYYSLEMANSGLAMPPSAGEHVQTTAEHPVCIPYVGNERHVFNQYVIRAARRDELMQWLKSNEVGCEIYYPVPLHLQECFRSLGAKHGDFPEAERAARETLALPVYPELTREQQDRVIELIASFYR